MSDLETASAADSSIESDESNRYRHPVKYGAIIFCLIVGFLLAIAPLPGVSRLLRELGFSHASLFGMRVLVDKVLVFALVIGAILYWEKEPLSSVGIRMPTLSDFGLGFAVFAAVFVLTGIMSVFVTTVLHHQEPYIRDAVGAKLIKQMLVLLRLPIWLGIAIAVANGVTEELVARGYAIERLQTVTGSVLIAAIIAYALDLAVHLPFWGPYNVLILAPGQLVFVLVYLWRRDLDACIVAHIMNDATPYLLTVVFSVFMAGYGHMSYYNAAGYLRYSRKDDRGAISEFTEDLQESPHDTYALGWRAWLYEDLGHYRASRKDFDELLRLRPKDAWADENLAWLLATCPNDRFRDGGKALSLALAACRLTSWKDAGEVDTLAAAYANVGDFAGAIKWEKRAIALGGESSCRCKRKRLALYEKHRPYRQSVDTASEAIR